MGMCIPSTVTHEKVTLEEGQEWLSSHEGRHDRHYKRCGWRAQARPLSNDTLGLRGHMTFSSLWVEKNAKNVGLAQGLCFSYPPGVCGMAGNGAITRAAATATVPGASSCAASEQFSRSRACSRAMHCR